MVAYNMMKSDARMPKTRMVAFWVRKKEGSKTKEARPRTKKTPATMKRIETMSFTTRYKSLSRAEKKLETSFEASIVCLFTLMLAWIMFITPFQCKYNIFLGERGDPFVKRIQ